MSSKSIGADTVFVPLNMLDDDPDNPRRTSRDEGVEGLAASIAAHGLLQPLGVVEHPDTEGRYVVKFGGRRLRALRLLAERRRVGKTTTVACRMLTPKESREAVLTENVNRVGMHPADMFEAFAELHDGGKGLSVDRIAQRFGCSSHTVRQRLRLGTLSPVIMDASGRTR